MFPISDMTRRFCSLISIGALFLVPAAQSPAQPTLSIDFAAFGAAAEDNPGDPEHPTTILFVGQPAAFELTVTNLSETEQTVFVGGGGGGGFHFEGATVVPEEAGECTLDPTFIDCPSLTIPGMGAGKSANMHNMAKVVLDVVTEQTGPGGASWFAGNQTSGESHTTGGQIDAREVTETHLLTVQSLPTFIEIEVTPGGVVKTDFTREYAAGTRVMLWAPGEVDAILIPLDFFSWFIDSDTGQESNVVSVVMDADHSALAGYGPPWRFGNSDLDGSTGKVIDPIDIYADGILIVEGLGPNQVTGPVTAPLQTTIDVTEAGAPDNSNPLQSFSYESDGSPVIVIVTKDSHYARQNARTEAVDSSQTDLTLLLRVSPETSEGIQIEHRTSTSDSELFGADNPADENRFTPYVSLEPGPGVVEILDRADGSQLEAFQGVLPEGAAMLGILKENGAGKRQGFTLLLFDSEGNNVEASVVTGTAGEPALPSSFALHPNYPNPFNPTTRIGFDVPTLANVRIDILNALGQIVQTLLEGPYKPGAYSVPFRADDLPSGTYFYRMRSGGFVSTRRMVLVR